MSPQADQSDSTGGAGGSGRGETSATVCRLQHVTLRVLFLVDLLELLLFFHLLHLGVDRGRFVVDGPVVLEVGVGVDELVLGPVRLF